jgi:hypothetical protein
MSLLSKTQVWNKDHPSLVTIAGQGKDHSPNGLEDGFEDIWFDDLVCTLGTKPLYCASICLVHGNSMSRIPTLS